MNSLVLERDGRDEKVEVAWLGWNEKGNRGFWLSVIPHGWYVVTQSPVTNHRWRRAGCIDWLGVEEEIMAVRFKHQAKMKTKTSQQIHEYTSKKKIQLKIKEGMNKNEVYMRFIGKTLEKE